MNLRFFLIVTSVFLSLFMISCDKEDIIVDSEHPSEIVMYVNQHFPSNNIIQVVKDIDGFTKTYDVILVGNIRLEFDKDYNIIEIDSDTKLPDSVIPSKILNYVDTNYPNSFIIGWELDKREQLVELQNNLELIFDLSENFIRVDN